MSWQAMEAVDSISGGITAREKLVLYALANRHKPEADGCYPSIANIAKSALASERSVQRCIASLVTKGMIEIIVGGGRGRASVYRLTFLNGDTTMSPFTSSERVTSQAERVTSQAERVTSQAERVTSQAERVTQLCHPNGINSNKNGMNGIMAANATKAIDATFLAEMATKFPTLAVKDECEAWEDWKAAQGKRFKDHRAAFRNWLRNAVKFQQRDNGGSRPRAAPPPENDHGAALLAKYGSRTT
jgi:hypothetical protein